MIIIESLGGLGNRMQAIDAAISLSQQTGQKLVVPWVIRSNFNARADQLFEISKIPAEFHYIYSSSLQRPVGEFLESMAINRSYDHFDVDWCLKDYKRFGASVCDVRSLSRQGNIHIRTWQHFFPSRYPYSFFVPNDEIQSRINFIASRFEDTCGVHIRRGDQHQCFRTAKTVFFMRAMENLIKLGIAKNFYIASDSERIKRLFQANFDTITADVPLVRNSLEGITGAMVDLYALSHAKLVLGSSGSTFSQVAARLRNSPHISITKTEAILAKYGVLGLKYYAIKALKLLGSRDMQSPIMS